MRGRILENLNRVVSVLRPPPHLDRVLIVYLTIIGYPRTTTIITTTTTATTTSIKSEESVRSPANLS